MLYCCSCSCRRADVILILKYGAKNMRGRRVDLKKEKFILKGILLPGFMQTLYATSADSVSCIVRISFSFCPIQFVIIVFFWLIFHSFLWGGSFGRKLLKCEHPKKTLSRLVFLLVFFVTPIVSRILARRKSSLSWFSKWL